MTAEQTIAFFDVSMWQSMPNHCLLKKRSAKKQTAPAMESAIAGNTKIFCLIAAAKSKWSMCITALVKPQPGQGIPKICFHMQSESGEKISTAVSMPATTAQTKLYFRR